MGENPVHTRNVFSIAARRWGERALKFEIGGESADTGKKRVSPRLHAI